jgi:hypothetical protein
MSLGEAIGQGIALNINGQPDFQPWRWSVLEGLKMKRSEVEDLLQAF